MGNLVQTANMLKSLPDAALQQAAQANSPDVPQYLVLAEMNRRKTMRSEAAAMAPKPDMTPVAQELMGQAQAPQGYAYGGLVGLAGGGLPDDPYYQSDAYMESGMPGLSGDAHPFASDVPVSQPSWLGAIDDFIGGSQKKMLQREARQKQERDDATAKSQKNLADRRAAAGNVPPPPMPPGAPLAQPAVPNPFAAAAKSAPVNIAPPPPVATVDARPARQTVPGQGMPSFSSPAAQGGTDPYEVDGAQAGGPDGMQQGIGGLPPPIEHPTLKTAKELLPDVQGAMPMTGYDNMLADFDKKKATNKADRDQALSMALMQAGFGMAASKSPFAMQAIGEGGLQGAKSFTESAGQIQAYDHKLDEQKQALALAKEAASMGQYKLANDMAEHANVISASIYGTDRKERGDDVRSIRTIQQEDRKDARYSANLKYQYDKMDTLERLKIDQMNRSDANAYLRLKVQMDHYNKLADKPTADMRMMEYLNPKDPELKASRQAAYGTMIGMKAGQKNDAAMRAAYAKLDPLSARRYPTYESWATAKFPGYADENGIAAPGNGFKYLGPEQ